MLDIDIAGKRGNFDYAVRFASSEKVTALFGVSGAGKSTVIDAISGELVPTNGKILVGDSVFFDNAAGASRRVMPIGRRRVGHIFQDGRLFPHMSVKRNLTYARWAGWRNRKTASFDAVVALLGLGDLLKRLPETLSGGERQRVAIGRALLSDPRILLMDEPLTGLDHQRKSEIMPYLEVLAHEMGVPMVYVSHDLDEVVHLAEYLVLLEHGRVVADGPIGDILPLIHGQFDFQRHVPSALLAARYIGPDPTYAMTWLMIGQQRLAVPEKIAPFADTLRVRVGASDVALALSAPHGISFQNILSGKIMSFVHGGGSFSDVTVSIDGQPLVARVTRRAFDLLALDIEKPVFALVKSVAIDGLKR